MARSLRGFEWILVIGAALLPAWQSVWAGASNAVPRSRAPSSTLDVLDVRSATPDERLMAACIQGLVNRARPRIYLLANSSDGFWLEVLKQRGRVKSTKDIKDLKELVNRYRSAITGAVIPDPELPATINVATMLAGVRSYVIASPRLARSVAIPVKADLRGKWESSVQAYEWAYKNLHDSLSRAGAAWACPTESFHAERDYLVQHKLWVFWISGPKDGKSPGADPEAEYRFVEKLLRGLPANTPAFGFPYGGEEIGIGEMGGTALTSAYGDYNVCTALCSNLSVHSGYPASALKQKPLPQRRFDADRVYLSFIISDGDNLQTFQEAHLPLWRDAARGDVAIAWTIGPAAALLMPEIVRYYYRSAFPEDRFVCDVSGAGYAYPGVFGAKLNRPALPAAYAKLTRDLCKPLDISILCTHQYLGTWLPQMKVFADNWPELGAIFADYTRRTGMTYSDSRYRLMRGRRPPIIVIHAWLKFPEKTDRESLIDQAVREIKDATTTRPAFLNCFVVNWFVRPSDLQDIMRRLGPDYVAVPPETLIAFSAKYTLQAAPEDNLALTAAACSPDGLAPDGRPGITGIENDRYACDGDYTTYWDEEDHKDEYVLQLRLVQKSTIRRIVIQPFEQEDHAPKSFDIICDGRIVKRVSDLRYRGGRAEMSLPPTSCKTLSLKIRESYGASPGIREIGVYGR